MALKHLVEYTVMIGLMTIFCPSLTSVYQALVRLHTSSYFHREKY